MLDHVSRGTLDFAARTGLASSVAHAVFPETRYAVLCRGKDGAIKWREECHNRVVNAGLNRLLAGAFTTGAVVNALTNEVFGSGNGSTTSFNHTLADISSGIGAAKAVKPGTFSVVTGAVTGTDNGAGSITGTGIAAGSTINYQTGACTVNFSAAPANAANNITCSYTTVATPAWYIGLVGPAVTDGAMASGNATLTCATSTPFNSVDVGRAIIVRGAGASGADLVTTISTFTDTGHVVLAATASTTVSSAGVLWEARPTDTMASHSPWTENAAYSGTNRQALTLGSITNPSNNASVDNSASVASFTMNTNNTLIGGVFLSDTQSNSPGNTGLLYGMAPFSTNGFRQVNNGDLIQVTATLTAASA